MYTLELIGADGVVKWKRDYPSTSHKNMLRVFTIIHTFVNNIKNNMGEELHGMEGFLIEGSDTIQIKHNDNV